MRIGEVLGNFNIDNRGNINSVGIKNNEVTIHTAHRSSKLNDYNNNKDTRVIKRGDVFYTELKGGGAHIHKGTKLVIVVQNDIGNKFAPIVNVVPLSSQIHKKLPVHIEINVDFLPMKSIALCEQTMPIPKNELMKKVGHLNESDMQNVGKGIMMQFGCIPIEKNSQYLN